MSLEVGVVPVLLELELVEPEPFDFGVPNSEESAVLIFSGFTGPRIVITSIVSFSSVPA